MGVRGRVTLAGREREEILADVRRAAGWLSESRNAIPDAAAGAGARAAVALGLALAVAVLDGEGSERGDPGALVALGALGGPPAARAAVCCDPELYDTIVRSSEAAVLEICKMIEYAGIAPCAAEARRELGLALAGRAFSAARAPRNGAFALRLLRVVAGERLDGATVLEALRYARRLQRVDGGYGHLPVKTRYAGDIRYVFHVPLTVAALWLIHDALAPRTFVRRALRSAPSADPERASETRKEGRPG